MLILELMTSLILWIAIMLPINSYLLGVNERSPYKLMQEVSNQTIFDVTKVASEANMNLPDLPAFFSEHLPNSYIFSAQNILVKSTSTEATGIVSDGQHLYVSLNSASTTDYDLMVYDYKNISASLDKVDSGPGLIGLTFIGKNLFAINSSVNSAIQRFKFDSSVGKINKVGDYKIPNSSSQNPLYTTKISSIYPYLFVGLKKNSNEELLSIDLNKIDLNLNLQTSGAINKKWEFDSSIQALWPIYDKYLHLLVSTAKEPEINDICLNCDFASTTGTSTTGTSSIGTFDIFGSLGNVRSLIASDGSIYVGRTAGNSELFKINMGRDYSSITGTTTVSVGATTTAVYDLINSIDVNEGVYSMLISNKRLFVIAGKTNSKIQIRDIDDLSKIIQTINTNSTISDLESVGDKVFGVGENITMNGTSTESIVPIIFELSPVY